MPWREAAGMRLRDRYGVNTVAPPPWRMPLLDALAVLLWKPAFWKWSLDPYLALPGDRFQRLATDQQAIVRRPLRGGRADALVVDRRSLFAYGDRVWEHAERREIDLREWTRV